MQIVTLPPARIVARPRGIEFDSFGLIDIKSHVDRQVERAGRLDRDVPAAAAEFVPQAEPTRRRASARRRSARRGWESAGTLEDCWDWGSKSGSLTLALALNARPHPRPLSQRERGGIAAGTARETPAAATGGVARCDREFRPLKALRPRASTRHRAYRNSRSANCSRRRARRCSRRPSGGLLLESSGRFRRFA